MKYLATINKFLFNIFLKHKLQILTTCVLFISKIYFEFRFEYGLCWTDTCQNWEECGWKQL